MTETKKRGRPNRAFLLRGKHFNSTREAAEHFGVSHSMIRYMLRQETAVATTTKKVPTNSEILAAIVELKDQLRRIEMAILA